MNRAVISLFIMLLAAIGAYAQGKGVDHQSDRIRDIGADRAPGANGVKQDVGTGRGIDFGKGRTPARPTLPNPYRFTARRDAVMQAVDEVMRERKLIPDTSASKPDEGLLITQPYTFSKGAVVTQSELSRYADFTTASARGWTRGRQTFIVEIQPVDGVTTNVSVNVKIEGRTDGVSGAEWVTLQSNGTAEQEFLAALYEKITGAPPTGNAP
jgi:hypothetical protein